MQLREAPEDLFLDELSKENFLTSCLTDLFFTIENLGGFKDKLCARAKKLRAHLEARFRWSFSVDDEGDEAPVVVDINGTS